MENKENLWWGNIPATPTNAETKPRRKKPYLAILGFGLVLTSMIGAISFLPDPNAPKPSSFNSIQTPANAYDTMNGCGGLFNFDVPKDSTGKLPVNFFKNPVGDGQIDRNVPLAPMSVQAYGYYYDNMDEPEKVFYDYDKNKLAEIPESVEYLSLMNKGWTVIWYANDSSTTVKKLLKEYAESKEKVLVLPWLADRDREIPMKRNFAFATWGMSRTCELWDDNTADRFVDEAQKLFAVRGEETYKAELDKNGELKLIKPQRSR